MIIQIQFWTVFGDAQINTKPFAHVVQTERKKKHNKTIKKKKLEKNKCYVNIKQGNEYQKYTKE